MDQIVENYLKMNKDFLIKLAMEICKLPSMTGYENEKAILIKEKLDKICDHTACIDEVGNVLYMYNFSRRKNFSIYAAHIDTVFEGLNNIEPKIAGDRIYAPSISDNSINVAALMLVIKMIVQGVICPKKNILFVFDVGEEGLGNLKGIKHIVEKLKNNIDEVIALDGSYASIKNIAVGSRRYSVLIQTPGGHSFSDFGNKSAILIAAEIIKEIYNIAIPGEIKTTYNIGVISGGTSVNTIAQSCEFNVDLRSEDKACLEKIEADFLDILKINSKKNITIQYDLIGQRPCGKISPNSDIMIRIMETRRALGLEIKFQSGSTDANIPLSMGIPAVSFGVSTGGGVHTTNEYINIESLEQGLKHLICFMLKK